MLSREIYKIWAPSKAKWIDWVRPVPFISIDNDMSLYDSINFMPSTISYIESISKNTAIIIDLPGIDSITEGLALAKIGFRPIPIYNGTIEQEGSISTVNNRDIEIGLINGSVELSKIDLPLDAPPCFLLDTNRMNRYKMNISIFDNSWDIYNQDLPTGNYFLKNGINKIIIRGTNKIQKDLKKILYKYQKSGIQIFFTNGFDEPKKVRIFPQPDNKDF